MVENARHIFRMFHLSAQTAKKKVYFSLLKSKRKANCHIYLFYFLNSMYYVTLNSSDNLTDSSSKIEEIVKTIVALIKEDDKVKIVLFSNWCTPLDALKDALMANNIKFRNQLKNFHLTISEFKNPDLNVTCLLLPLSYGSNGLNLVEATHVFLIDSILNPGEELQAIGRVHRIGQTR